MEVCETEYTSTDTEFFSSIDHYIGRQARAYRTIDPKHTFFNAKRFIGRSYSDVLADKETEYEFEIDSISTGANQEVEPCFRVNLTGHPSCVTPIYVGTQIVKHLREIACRFVGHDQVRMKVGYCCTRHKYVYLIDYKGCHCGASRL